MNDREARRLRGKEGVNVYYKRQEWQRGKWGRKLRGRNRGRNEGKEGKNSGQGSGKSEARKNGTQETRMEERDKFRRQVCSVVNKKGAVRKGGNNINRQEGRAAIQGGREAGKKGENRSGRQQTKAGRKERRWGRWWRAREALKDAPPVSICRVPSRRTILTEEC